jgi:dihydroorotate dehydrogenase (NAD+) catalytic subunit
VQQPTPGNVPSVSPDEVDLTVNLGPLALRNPVLVASGTFGYAREMAAFVPFEQLGGIIPKTVTRKPRIGNPPPRTVETACGLLNSIGLDNDGLEAFIEKHVPYLTSLNTAIIANIAGHDADEFVDMAARVDGVPGLAGLELNMSCPNVAGGIDFATDPALTERVVSSVRKACRLPLIAKLAPVVTDIVSIARAAANGGADAISLTNTFPGMAIHWRKRQPVLGNVVGGVSGPAIKPMVLRIVWTVSRQVSIPIIGVGGISSVDDVMEFLLAGASAIQIGTANFYNPQLSGRLTEPIAAAVAELGARSVRDIVGTLQAPSRS